MKKLLFVLCLVVPSLASAQSVPTTGYELDITGTASSTYSFSPSTVQCGISTVPGQPGTINPRYLVWDDTATTVCVHDTGNNTGYLFALPIGNYGATLFATNGTGTDKIRSNPSNAVSFTRRGTLAAPTGLRVRVAQ